LLVNPYNITTSITIIHCFLIFFPIKHTSVVPLYWMTVFPSWYSQDWLVTSIIPELIISQHWFWTLLNWINHVKSTFLIAKSNFLLYISYPSISHTIYISHQIFPFIVGFSKHCSFRSCVFHPIFPRGLHISPSTITGGSCLVAKQLCTLL
jgi:hypothetical protein